MAILGRGIYGLPLDTDSLIIGVGGVLEEFPKGNIDDVLAVTSMGVMWTPASVLSGGGGGAVDSVNGMTGAVTLSLDDLDDVVAGTPANNEVLTYAGGVWVSAPPPGATGGEANTGLSIGTGADVFAQKVGTQLQFRSILAGSSNVTVTENTNEIVIDVPNIGETNTVSSVGAGISVYSTKVGSDLVFKTLTAGPNVTLDNTSDPNEIEISVSIPSAPVTSVNGFTGAVSLDIADLTDVSFSGSGAPAVGEVLTFNGVIWEAQPASGGTGGEANTASNLGAGANVFAQKTGVNFEFRSLVGSGGISVVQSGTHISIDGSSISGTVTSVGLNDSTGDFIISNTPITTSGNINLGLSTTGVTPGTYTNANITVDSRGRIGFASNGSAAGSLAINDLTDVNTAGATSGQVLVYDTGTNTWLPGNGAVGDLNDLGDVDTTGVTNGQVLVYNSGTMTWGPGTPASGGSTSRINDIADTTFVDTELSGFAGEVVIGSNSTPILRVANDAGSLDGETMVMSNGNGEMTLSAISNTLLNDVDIRLIPQANGQVLVGDGTANGFIQAGDEQDLVLYGGAGTNGGNVILGGSAPSATNPGIVQSLVTTEVPDIVITGTTTINTVAYTWPASDGTTGQFLTTNGTGGLSWSTGGGGSTQNLWETITADTGSTTADTATDTLTVTGGTDITTAVAGDTLTISFSNTSGYLTEVVQDTTPQLGGDLDVNGNAITSATGTDITLTPGGVGEMDFGGVKYQKKQIVAVPDNTTSVFASIPTTDATAIFIDYVIQRNATARTGSVMVSILGSTAELTDVGSDIGFVEVDFSVAIVGGNIELSYTSQPTGFAANLAYQLRYFNFS